MDRNKLQSIGCRDNSAAEAARRRWDGIAKPLGSLGALEDIIVKIAELTGTPEVRLIKRAVLVLCADNGVVREGVSQSDPGVTMLVAENLTKKMTSVCRMAAVANADVIPVDMGMASLPGFSGLIDRRTGPGTGNIFKEPAMTVAQAEKAIDAGISLVEDCKNKGYSIIATGEMGIANTTTSSAMASVLLGVPVTEVTGRGAGLSDASLLHKIEVIETAIAVNKPDHADAVDVLSKLGGFDIAGMTGIFIGGAVHGVPILIDGFISSVAALTASLICPGAKNAMLASHVSGEPAGKMMLEKLELSPLITAGMRLGEGTGAVSALPLLDMALAVYHGSSSFSDIGMEAYEHWEV